MTRRGDVFDGISPVVPEEWQAEYWRGAACMREAPTEDVVVQFIKMMGIFTFILRDLPTALTKEREALTAQIRECYEEFSRRVAVASEQTKDAAAEAEQVATAIIQANGDMREVASQVREAAIVAGNNVDVEALSHRLTAELEERTIKPHARVVEATMQSVSKLDEVTASAEKAVTVWRKIHLRSAWLTACLVAFCVSGFILFLAWRSMESHYAAALDRRLDELTRNVERNKGILAKLARSNVKFHISRTMMGDGNLHPSKYALGIHPASKARMETNGVQSNIGVIYFDLEPETLLRAVPASSDETGVN